MIYDCFPFFNELELLELRLHELDDVVDKFVLAEATMTHSGKAKPLYFEENRNAFSKFSHKIIHVIVRDIPAVASPGKRATFHRDGIARGLINCKPQDVILVSDIDEIPRAEKVKAAAEQLPFNRGVAVETWHRLLKNRIVIWTFRNLFKKRHPFVRMFQQQFYMYFLNFARDGKGPWVGTRMTHYRDFSTADELRRWRGARIFDGGWHFSYMGGVERLQTKLASYSHQEFNTPDFNNPDRLADVLRKGYDLLTPEMPLRRVAIDDSYPAYLRANLFKYKHWISPQSQALDT